MKEQVWLGNSLELMKNIPDGGVDLTVTSPPYDNLRTYNGSLEWGEHVWRPIIQELYRVTKDGGVVVWIVGDATIKGGKTGTSFKQCLHAIDCGFNFHDNIIWQKPNYAPMYPSVKRCDSNFEYMFVWSNGQPKSWNPIKDKTKKESTKNRGKYKTSFAKKDGGRYESLSTANSSEFSKRNNVWVCPNGQKRGIGHPAPFPEQLAKDHIISWSNENDVVLDCFAGSGTTGLAAKSLNRQFILIEKEKEYYDICLERLK